MTAIAITGKSQSITLNAEATSVYFTPDDPNAAHVSLAAVATLTVLRPPDNLNPDGSAASWEHATQTLTLSVADTNGRSGTVTAKLSDFTLGLAAASAPIVQEFALISGTSVQASPFPHTRIQLQTPLVNCYDRTAHQHQRERRPRHRRQLGHRSHGQRVRVYHQPGVHPQAIPPHLRPGAHFDGAAEHSSGSCQWGRLDGGTQPLWPGQRGPGVRGLGPPGRWHSGRVRRRRGRSDAADGAEQRPGQLPGRVGIDRQRRGRERLPSWPIVRSG